MPSELTPVMPPQLLWEWGGGRGVVNPPQRKHPNPTNHKPVWKQKSSHMVHDTS